ncbi:MAG: hypothetical protein RSB70_04070 [Clostridium sp.]
MASLNTLSVEDQEILIRSQLGEDKCKLLDKYNLRLNSRLYFERIQEKYPTQEYFSYKLALKSSVIGIIFHINRLCFAKTKYFENNIDYFSPCIHTYKDGFIETDIWNMEYLKQKNTGIIIDLRELSKIKWLRDFKSLCFYLESEQEKCAGKICSNNSNLVLGA